MAVLLKSRYEILKELAAGGFGQTYLAKDRDLPGEPLCVVKQLKPKDPKLFQQAQRKFEDEANSLYRLGEHDRIPRLLAHFEEAGNFYLVQEYVRGQPLDRALTAGEPLSQDSVMTLLADILQVLDYVHSQNAIHRDIKPANLIRRERDGKVVLIDFGAVKEVRHLSSGNGLSPRSVAIGTPGYTPIEQQMGEPHYSSDLYATGVVCLQALTALSPDDLPKDKETKEYRCELLQGRASISPELAKILNKMLRKDYRLRYPNAAEALKDVREAIARSAKDTVVTPTPPRRSGSTGPTGNLDLESEYYVERKDLEDRCDREILKQAALIRLKAPMDMGKTSLMVRILDYARKQGYRTVIVPFSRFEESVYSDLNQLFRRFCAVVSRGLGISPKRINDYWDEEFFGPQDNCSQYFEECLLKEIDCPLVLALDDLDSLFYQHRVAKEFLKLVRYWHEQAKANTIWSKVKFILAYSTEVYVVMDTNSSPFNVGMQEELPEFSVGEVLDMAHHFGLDWDSTQVNRLFSTIGGHPYLVRVALENLATKDLDLEQLLKSAPTDAGLYGNHLRRHLQHLKKDPELLSAMKAVVSASQPVCLEPGLEFKLHGLGLVNLEGNEVYPRSELYRKYFRDRLKVHQ